MSRYKDHKTEADYLDMNIAELKQQVSYWEIRKGASGSSVAKKVIEKKLITIRKILEEKQLSV